jgi:hypothetical protein
VLECLQRVNRTSPLAKLLPSCPNRIMVVLYWLMGRTNLPYNIVLYNIDLLSNMSIMTLAFHDAQMSSWRQLQCKKLIFRSWHAPDHRLRCTCRRGNWFILIIRNVPTWLQLCFLRLIFSSIKWSRDHVITCSYMRDLDCSSWQTKCCFQGDHLVAIFVVRSGQNLVPM